MLTETKDTLIKEIIEEELVQFLSVQNRGGIANCQERPDSFKIMRRMAHEVQSEAYLHSYLADLQSAKKDKRNVMTEKYARMENLIEQTNFDPHIEKILAMELQMYDAVYKKYPQLFNAQNIHYFKNYLSCELETLSPQSLQLYHENLINANLEGRNLLEERYETLMRLLGKPPLSNLK